MEDWSEKSDDELYEDMGRALTKRVIECLNEALVSHGGQPTEYDGMAHPLSDYIAQDKISQVLVDARRLAEERGLAVGAPVGLSSVVTDDEALIYIIGDLTLPAA